MIKRTTMNKHSFTHNGITLTLTLKSKWVGPDKEIRKIGGFYSCSRMNYRIHLSANDNEDGFDFTFHGSVHDYDHDKTAFTEDLAMNALYSVLLDATSYINAKDLRDFACEFGYENFNEARAVYNGCREEYENLSNLLTDDEMFDLSNKLSEMGY